MRAAYNDKDDRAGLRGYVQFNKYTYTHTHLYVLRREGRKTFTPVDPQVDTAAIRTTLSTNRVDSGSFSSRCCAFRRTHTSVDPIWLLVSD